MGEVEETLLPGVGVRYEFVTGDGERIGVLVHHGGRRDLFAPQAGDPDACEIYARLDPDDARTLASLLGVPHIGEQLNEVQHEIEGLSIDWLRIKAGSPLSGRSLAESAIQAQTGASVVAVTRGTQAVASPPADFVLEEGDLIVAVGQPDGVARLDLLTQTPR